MRLKAAFAATAVATALATVPAAIGLSSDPAGATVADAPPGVDTPPGDAFNDDPSATFVGYPHRCGPPQHDPGPQ